MAAYLARAAPPTVAPTLTPTVAPTSTPTVAPSAVPTTAPDGSGGAGGGLPVTGAAAGTVAGIGGALLFLGAVGYLIARRRRTRFVA